eukprot:Pompholyxophrys_punicea_v1_NODE_128_length_3306_cov_6.696401.p4 type:complete len:105 gc:universal NODE_128_length_3306_cov_6.696401:3274-2960(-)
MWRNSRLLHVEFMIPSKTGGLFLMRQQYRLELFGTVFQVILKAMRLIPLKQVISAICLNPKTRKIFSLTIFYYFYSDLLLMIFSFLVLITRLQKAFVLLLLLIA